MIDNLTTTDIVEWQHQLQINCIWRDWDFYFDIQEILPFFVGFMLFSDSSLNGKKLLAEPYKFNTYTELVDYVKGLPKGERYLHCVLKHRWEDRYCLRYADK